MTMSSQALQYGKRRITRKLLRAVPWVGAIVAIATLGKAIQRKGLLPGSVDTALDFVPFVGGAKNVLEIARGRDFIRDRQLIQDRAGATR
jgi:hypothetical protein